MDKRTYWATRPSTPEYESITFSHPAFTAPIRLVSNQFAEVTLGGFVHTPAPMKIKAPDQSGNAQTKLQMSFPRAVVGREFKRQLRLVADYGVQTPISVLYARYLGDTDAPEITWSLYVSDTGGVTFGQDSVQVTASDDNPMRRSAALLYDPTVWSGLEVI